MIKTRIELSRKGMSEAAEVRWVLGSGEAAAGAEGCDYDD
jgi:hypothetical protein